MHGDWQCFITCSWHQAQHSPSSSWTCLFRIIQCIMPDCPQAEVTVERAEMNSSSMSLESNMNVMASDLSFTEAPLSERLWRFFKVLIAPHQNALPVAGMPQPVSFPALTPPLVRVALPVLCR